MSAAAYSATPRPAQHTPSHAQREIERLRHELRQAKQDQARLRALMRLDNDILSPAQKWLFLAAFPILDKAQRDGIPQPAYRADLARTIGLKDQSVSDGMKRLEECGLVRRTYSTTTDPQTGKPRQQLYLAPGPTTYQLEQLAQVDRSDAPAPRNHGGTRPRCPRCGSEDVNVQKVITCNDPACRHIETVDITRQQASATTAPAPDFPPCQIDILRNSASQSAAAEADATPSPPCQLDTEERITNEGGGILPPCQFDILGNQLGQWLAELAGDDERHIEMQAEGPDKYRWCDGPITPDLAAAHLAGEVTLGATLQRQDGRTLAHEWDVDTLARYRTLQTAAVQLRASGAYATFSPSPQKNHDGSQRGGRLTLWYAEPVDAADAYATALAIAPDLADVAEYWPNPKSNQATRLPFARYRRGTIDAWCETICPDGEIVTGTDAAHRVMLDARTPRAWVTETAPPKEAPAPRDTPPSLVFSPAETVPDAQRSEPLAMRDPAWIARYGTAAPPPCWFAILPAAAAAYFNATHPIDAVLTFDRNGRAFATWRGDTERPNVRRSSAGGWIDDGVPDDAPHAAGDAFEAYCLTQDRTRGDVLAETTREMLRSARWELESAARASTGTLPAWVAEITTPAGWNHYDELRRQGALDWPSQYAEMRPL